MGGYANARSIHENANQSIEDRRAYGATTMKLPINYSNDLTVQAAFTWATQSGIGVRFGSRPIGWYQMHQCAALDIVTERAQQAGIEAGSVRYRSHDLGVTIEAQSAKGQPWIILGNVRDIFNEADKRARS